MSDRKAAALTHLIVGGLTVLRAGYALVRPAEPSLNTVWNEFLFRYGGPISGLIIGGALIGVGLFTLKATDRAATTRELNFIYEAALPLAPAIAAFLFWLGIGSGTAILPYTGERGIEVRQLIASPLVFLVMLGGAWFFLHYRRLTILDSVTRTFEISYGKPWAVLTLRYEFSDYQSIAIEEVERARGSVYRLVASGPKGSKLITFTFDAESAKTCAQNIAQATGWAIATTAVSPRAPSAP